MLEKMKSVSNPLTIVGLFCGVVEVAGLIVLGTGNITPEAQRDLIWLVKWFPVLLVSLFFVTLRFKGSVPSPEWLGTGFTRGDAILPKGRASWRFAASLARLGSREYHVPLARRLDNVLGAPSWRSEETR